MFKIDILRMVNIFEVSISLVGGLILGILASWFYWRPKISEQKDRYEELETSLTKKNSELNARIRKLNKDLSQREETITNLNSEIRDREGVITDSKDMIAGLEKQSSERLNRAEDAETQISELENSLNLKEQEITTLTARVNVMQDDLSIIDGIGPKVSAVLRLAGIKSFNRLASTNIKRIEEILVAENPNLLRLTDPSTWSEQAKIAADGDWEALSQLQQTLKEARRA